MKTLLNIDGNPIRQFYGELYCLNDLHKAAGGEERHKPRFWLRNILTQKLVKGLEAIRPVVINVNHGGLLSGTFVCKELVFAYAMWISPEFYIRVITECPLIFSLQGKDNEK
ncbi:MAG: KilA-N domain-containing protein [Rahnella inusitata]|jgi:hypothetical protein|uniref:KilA-N domain-containing protein n=1 Tax=Rahnella inusitata TaxID=58169 RepID=UPI002F3C2A45